MATIEEIRNEYCSQVVMKLASGKDSNYERPEMRLVIGTDGAAFLEGSCYKATPKGRAVFQYVYGHLNDEQIEAMRTMLNEYHDAKAQGNVPKVVADGKRDPVEEYLEKAAQHGRDTQELYRSQKMSRGY